MKLGALGALAAVSLLVVMTGPSEGRKISACDLKAKLQKKFPKWGPFRITRAVCQVGIMSGLNTSLVRKCLRANLIPVKGGGMETLELRGEQITEDPLPEEDNLEEEEQEGGDDGDEGGEDVEDRRTLSKPKKRPAKPARRRCQPGTGYYGIFQLSDRIHCDSGENPTMNLCRTSCSAFKDDDIADDIRCIHQTSFWRHLYYRKPLHCQRYRCP